MIDHLSESERRIITAMGITPEGYIASRNAGNDKSVEALTSDEQKIIATLGLSPSTYIAMREANRGFASASAIAGGEAIDAQELSIIRTSGIDIAGFLAARAAAGGSTAIAHCSMQLPTSSAGQQIEMQLTPAGEFRPSDGRRFEPGKWFIDSAVADDVIQRFNARSKPAVLDYEHQTLHKEKNGQPAPAAGWIKQLTWRHGVGLFGTTELTALAQQMVANREYLFVSPVFHYDAKTGNVLDVLMAGLTNDPALHGMRSLAA